MDKKSAITSISLLWLGSVGGAAFAFITQILLARELGPSGFGTFLAAFAVVTLFTPFAGFGVPGFLLSVFGREGCGATRWLHGSFALAIIGIVTVIAAILAWAELGPNDNLTTLALIILSACVAGQLAVDLVSSKFQLEERYSWLALWQVFQNLGRLISVVVLSIIPFLTVDVISVAAAYALVALIILVCASGELWKFSRGQIFFKGDLLPINQIVKFKLPLKSSHLRVAEVASASWPFAVDAVFYLIYFQSNIILIKYISDSEQAGLFGVATVFMSASYLLPSVIYQKYMLPKLHRWAHTDRERLRQIYHFGNRVMLALGLVTTILLWIIAWWIIPAIFGPAYKEAVPLLGLLALCAPLRFLVTSVGAMLLTHKQMKIKIYCMSYIALLSIFLNIMLVPSYGAFGSTVSTLVCEVCWLVLYLRAVRKHVFVP